MAARPLIVGVDPHRLERGALALASLLARSYGAPVVAIAAIPRHPLRAHASGADLEAALREEATTALARAAAELPTGTLTHAVVSESPARALHEAATAHDARLLVVGSAHRGPLGRLTPGSVADRILYGSRCPVAVAPRGYEPPANGLRRIGVAFVDTPEGREALDGAAALAAGAGAALEVTTIVEWFDPTGMVDPPAGLIEHEHEQATQLAEEAAHRALDRVAGTVAARVVILAGGTTAELVDQTAALDMLVCGSRGYGPVRSVLLGSVSHALAHHSRCPLIVVPRGTEPALESLASESSAGVRRP